MQIIPITPSDLIQRKAVCGCKESMDLTLRAEEFRTNWLAASVDVTRRVWRFADLEGVDAKGKLANGNYWRHTGHSGESISYYDIGSNAAAYFDRIIDHACFHDWRDAR